MHSDRYIAGCGNVVQCRITYFKKVRPSASEGLKTPNGFTNGGNLSFKCSGAQANLRSEIDRRGGRSGAEARTEMNTVALNHGHARAATNRHAP